MIDTDRLILRLFKESDSESYYNILNNKLVYQWLGKGQEKNKEQIKKIINYDLNHWKTHEIGTWAVILKKDNTLIGHCGFNYIEALDKYELLYAFDQNHWGKGYATEACEASLQWIRNSHKLEEVIALSYPNNEKSIHLIKKLGFKFDKSTILFGVKLFLYHLSI